MGRLTRRPGAPMIHLYLDTCCFSRPSDDHARPRVRLESEAILGILERVVQGEWTLVGSDVVQEEIAAIRDPDRRASAQGLAGFSSEHVGVDEDRQCRGEALERMGVRGYDSLHVACAEAAGADVLLTTDHALIRRAGRLRHQLAVRVANPVSWLEELE